MQPKIIKPGYWPAPKETVKVPTDEELSVAIHKMDIVREELTRMLEAVRERSLRLAEEMERLSLMGDAIEEALREPLSAEA